MQVKSIAECPLEHSAILSTFRKLPFHITIFVLSIFEWPIYTGFTVLLSPNDNPVFLSGLFFSSDFGVFERLQR